MIIRYLSCINVMREKIFLLFSVIWLALPFRVSAQIDEAKRIQDSITIARSEQRLSGDTTGMNTLPASLSVFDSTSAFSKLDTSKTSLKKHSAKRAVFFSAVLPGLGQAYNKKYWKIPIVYAGFAGLSYAVFYTATNYKNARDAYRLQADDDPNTIGSFQGTTNEATLKEYRDYHKRNLTISGFCLGLWYCLNLIDAAVDAHLFDFNMSDKLTMHVQPSFGPAYGNYAYNGFSYGGQIHLTF